MLIHSLFYLFEIIHEIRFDYTTSDGVTDSYSAGRTEIEFTADDQFKSYEDLKFRLESTLKGNYSKPVDEETFGEDVESTPAPVASAAPSAAPEQDTLSYFAQLAQDD